MEHSAKKAIVIGCLVLCLGNLLLAAFYLLPANPPAVSPVVLPDGTSVRIADITVGTTHQHGSVLAKFLNRLPNRLRQPLVKRFPNGSRLSTLRTPETNLVLWMEYRSPPGLPSTSARVMLRPVGGVTGAHFSTWSAPGAAKTAVAYLALSAWPRRVRDLEAVVFAYVPAQGYVEAGVLPFRNPTVYEGPDWTPTPLPAVTNAGDLNVTLLDFASGIGNKTERNWDTDRPRVIYKRSNDEEPRSLVRVAFESPRGTNETWQIFDADLLDVTGNKVEATSRSGMTSDMTDMTFSPILWPDERAWKLRLHLKRKTGFLPEEQLTFSNITIPAVGSSNRIGQIVPCKGIAVELRSFTRQPNLGDRRNWSSHELSSIRVHHPDLGKTNQLDLLDIVVHPYGTNLVSGGSSWNETYHEFQLRSIPSGATHLDLRFSVQPTRFAEFMVAPNQVTNDYVVDAE